MPLPDAAARPLVAAGFNVCGLLSIETYDSLVPPPWRSARVLPGARSVAVLGTGGGRFESLWLAARDEARVGTDDPADDFARAALEHARTGFDADGGTRSRAFQYADQLAGDGGDPVFADFVALARAAGLGAPGRLGLLLHPEFGAWWSARALLLTTWAPVPPAVAPVAVADFCADCAAPCIEACPGSAATTGGFVANACSETRLGGVACADRCDARRACIVGPEHFIGEQAEAWYSATSLAWLEAAAEGRDGSA